jgi:PKD repeat protein
MTKLVALFPLWLCLLTGTLYAQTTVQLSPLQKANAPILTEQFKDYQTIELDFEALYEMYQASANEVKFSLAAQGKQQLDFRLTAYDLRGKRYHRQTMVDGRVKQQAPTRTATFRGTVGLTNPQEALFTFDENYVLGRWEEQGVVYYLEPLWRFDPEADRHHYLVYREQDAIIPAEYCATHIPAQVGKLQEKPVTGPEKLGECLLVEIALASDFELFQDFGSNATSVENFMLNSLANVQTNYDNEFADEIQFEVVTTFIATCNNTSCDPWTNNTNAGTLLDDFVDWGNGGGFGVTFDVATLWTGRNFNGGTIGVAYLSGVCTSLRYNTCENFSSNANLIRVVWSHELGHNFSAQHDAGGSGFIMAPSVNNTTTWSPASINSINNFVSNANCLGTCESSQEPPVAVIEAAVDEACTESFVAFFDESEGVVLNRTWDFPGGTPSFSTAAHPIVYYSEPGTYQAFLSVENNVGDDFVSFVVEVGLDENYRKVLHFQNFENGFGSWDVENPDNDETWEITTVDGNFGDKAAFVNNFDYDADGETDALISPGFNLSAEGDVRLSVEYAYARFNNALRDQLRISLSTDGGSTFPNLLFEGDETGGGNFATTGDRNNAFTPQDESEWCTNSPGCIDLDLSAFDGQGDVVIKIENINGYGNNMYVDNISLTSYCGAIDPPVANFEVNPTIGCAPLVVSFDDLSTGVVEFWDWSFPGGNPSFSNDQFPFTEYNTPGVYDVSLTVENNVGSDTHTEIGAVTILGLPTPGFTFTNTSGLTYQFMNTSSSDVEDFAWDFDDGTFSQQENPLHTFPGAGTYLVELEVFNECGSDVIIQTIIVDPVLVADFTSDVTNGCADLTVQFTDLSDGDPDAWSWEFPGGLPAASSEPNPQVVYATPGVYDVTLTVEADGLFETITFSDYITVQGLPTASFTATLAPGEASPVIVNNSTNADSYSWTFGNGETSSLANPTVTYTEAGTYVITLTATNECGSVETTQTVEVIFPVTPAFASTGTTGCAPWSVDFTAQPQEDGLIYEWAFPGGDPATSTDPNPTVNYLAAGAYDVILTITNAAGSASVTETSYVVVNEGPTAGFTATATLGSLTVDLTDLSSNTNGVTWDFGDGNSSTDTPSSYTYEAEGTYVITQTVENECGTDVATQTVTLVLPVTPVITSSVTSGCAPLTVTFTASPQADGYTYAWSFPGGAPMMTDTPEAIVIYNAPGTYSVALTITNAAGASTITETDLIVVAQGPTADFSFSNNLGSAVVNFTDNSSLADDLQWFFGDGTTSVETNPEHTYATEGSYEIALVATNECGTDTSRQTVAILFAPEPTITASVSSGCAPLTVTYTAQPQGPGLTYLWDIPGGTPMTSTNPVVTVVYNGPGNFTASVSVTNAAGTGTTQTTTPVMVLPEPMVTFNIDYTLGAYEATFTSTSQGVDNLTWDFGDGNTDEGATVAHTYATAGNYVVSLTGTGPCGTETISQTIMVIVAPVGGFTSTGQSGCTPFTTTFSANDEGNTYTYAWTFIGGSPEFSDEANPTVTYATAGVYSVGLVVTNAAGTAAESLEDYIVVGQGPAADFTLAATLGSLTIDATGSAEEGITSWAWDFGDGNQANGMSVTHTYETSGTYTVQLTTTNECGSNTTEQSVTVLTVPMATFTSTSLSVCPDEMIVLTADEQGDGYSYSWTIDGGTPATSSDASVMTSFAAAGTYQVGLSVTNAAGTTTTEQTVEVIGLPDLFFTYTLNGLTATFENLSTDATSYIWLFPGGVTSNEENPEFTFPGVGSYFVTLNGFGPCGLDQRQGTVVVEGAIPSISFTQDNEEGCGPLTVSFVSTTENADALMWNFPGGNPATSTEVNPVVTYSTPGVYNVSLSASNAFGTNSVTSQDAVTIYATTAANFDYTLNGTTATFTNTSSAETGTVWTFSDGSTSTMDNPSFTFPGNGTYEVSLMATGLCNDDEVTQTIVIDGPLPVVTFDSDKNSGCAPFTVTFTDVSENTPTSWAWSFPGATPATGDEAAVTVTYEAAGTYAVSLEVSNIYGTTMVEVIDYITVSVAPDAPVFTTASDDEMTYTFTVDAPIAGLIYSWTFGDGEVATGENVEHTYLANGPFEVSLVATNDCGSATATEMVDPIISSVNTPAWAFDLTLSPNPTSDQLFLRATNWPTQGALSFRLINALGQHLGQEVHQVTAGNWQQQLDLSKLPAGTYWLQISWANEVWSQKVIKL